MKIRVPVWKSLLLILLTHLLVLGELHSQSYTARDSVEIYERLTRADIESVSGSLDVAMHHARMARELSIKYRMPRGEGFGLLKIADVMLHKDSVEGIATLYNHAEKIATQLKDSFMLALGFYQQGQLAMRHERYTEADFFFDRALNTHFEKTQDSYTAFVYNDIGYLRGMRDEYEKEAFWYLKALRVHERVGYLDGIATSKHNLANVYHKLGHTDKAADYIRTAISIRTESGDIKGLANAYESLSRLYWATSLDSASKYQQLALRYAEQTGLKRTMIRSYDNLSVLMDRRREKASALEYIRKSIALCEEIDDKTGLASKYRWAALLCGDLKDTTTAEEYFRKSYAISSVMDNKALLRDFHGTRASYYRRTEQWQKAFESQKKYYDYRDSLLKEETETNIIELQTKYETEKKDNEISRLNNAQRIRQLEIEKQRAIIEGSRLEALRKENEILLLSQQQQLQEARIREQNEELEKQSLLARNNAQELLLASQERKLKEEELAGQKSLTYLIIAGSLLLAIIGGFLFNRYKLKKKIEQQRQLLSVRNDIARDLHDEIGSTLTSIRILSEVSKSSVQKDLQKTSVLLSKISEQSEQIQQGMSDIVWSISPDKDKFGDMIVRMREYASQTLEPKNIESVIAADEGVLSQGLDMHQRRDLFLIFKEAVNNVVKYSNATKVRISITVSGNELTLSVRDNGKGFDPSRERSSGGLKNMRTRAEAMKGKLSIQSKTGEGTSIIALIPLNS